MKNILTIILVSVISLFGLYPLHAQSGTWISRNTTFFDPRTDFTAASVNNIIYVMGGVDPFSIGVYNPAIEPANNSWSNPHASGNFTARRGLTSSVVNGKIYVFGGFLGSGPNATNTVEVFDPVANKWTTPVTTGVFTARGGLSSAAVNGKIYVLGGSLSDTHTFVTLLKCSILRQTTGLPRLRPEFSPLVGILPLQ